jgi:hypothetical protein
MEAARVEGAAAVGAAGAGEAAAEVAACTTRWEATTWAATAFITAQINSQGRTLIWVAARPGRGSARAGRLFPVDFPDEAERPAAEDEERREGGREKGGAPPMICNSSGIFQTPRARGRSAS